MDCLLNQHPNCRTSSPMPVFDTPAVEQPEPVPLSHRVAKYPLYKLTQAHHVQEKSKPITKTSRLRVDAEGMRIFGELAGEMVGEGRGGRGMIFLVACLLERLFGKGAVEGIDDIRGGAS
ncbi:hypothetical protein B0H17DRAFT_1209767 [Mycena rosella]|uniref:Uncharacterized protein n=1 Tax=Mycena rosella TaxID=1033263 RepID=A0AAD7CXF8_MYCRO|nr:hypothetical protein B0H17DRAFT_1209767 [Mycena rosella]